MRWSLPAGRILGIQIRVHVTFLLFVAWIAILQGVTRGSAAHAFAAAVLLVLVFGCVLLHELGHAMAARRYGIRTRDIVLLPIGGIARLERMPENPAQEIVVALAGPAVNVVIAAVLWLAGSPRPTFDAGAALGSDLVTGLLVINIIMVVFNLIPAFPMDGGRVLRAVLWRVRGDRLVATRNAALVGRAFAYLLIGFGVFIALQPGASIVSGLWLALIGWFLSNAAESTVAQAGVESSLRGVRVRDAMDPAPSSVGPNESVADLVQERMLRGEERSFLVRHDDGGLAGLVTLTDVRRLARDQWPGARVTDIMTRYGDLATIGPEAPLADALRLLQERDIGQLPVIDGDGRNPVGLVTRRGILRLIEARMKLGM